MATNGRGEKQKLLLIPFAPGIGDMVMMEPLLRAAVEACPERRVTMVARDYAADILPPGPYDLASSQVFMAEAPGPLKPFHRLIPQRVIAWAAQPAMSMDLGLFDQVVNLFWYWESNIPFGRWWNPGLYPDEPVRHTVDVLADQMERDIGRPIPGEERIPRVWVSPEGQSWSEEWAAGEGVRDAPLAALVVSAANPLKLWDPARWAEVNDQLVSQGFRTVIVAPRDNSHAGLVFRLCRTKPEWPDVDLRQMVGLLSRCGLAVSIDTGPLHIASALGIPWIGLFGPTHPGVVGPYDTRRGRALIVGFEKPESCKDCYLSFKNRDPRCLTITTTGCTRLIAVDAVMEAVGQLSPLVAAASPSEMRSLSGDRTA